MARKKNKSTTPPTTARGAGGERSLLDALRLDRSDLVIVAFVVLFAFYRLFTSNPEPDTE